MFLILHFFCFGSPTSADAGVFSLERGVINSVLSGRGTCYEGAGLLSVTVCSCDGGICCRRRIWDVLR